jgi:hypothetical protein
MESNSQAIEFAGGTLGRRRHICAFFNNSNEEHNVLRAYIKEGLDLGQKAFHIVDPECQSQHLAHLAEAGIDVPQAMGTGQLQVRAWEETYFREDRFDRDSMLTFVDELLESGREEGFPLTRCLAHMGWVLLDKPGIEKVLEYEIRLNYMLREHRDPIICIYDLTKFESSMAVDIMRAHPVVIIGGVLQENPFFVPPEQYLFELRERKSKQRKSERI